MSPARARRAVAPLRRPIEVDWDALDRYCAQRRLTSRHRSTLLSLLELADDDGEIRAFGSLGLTGLAPLLGYGSASGRRTLSGHLRHLADAGMVKFEESNGKPGRLFLLDEPRDIARVSDPEPRDSARVVGADPRDTARPAVSHPRGIARPEAAEPRDSARVRLDEHAPSQVDRGEHTVARNRAAEPLTSSSSSRSRDLLLGRLVSLGVYTGAINQALRLPLDQVEVWLTAAERSPGPARRQAAEFVNLMKLGVVLPPPSEEPAAAAPDPFGDLEAEAERHRRTRDLVGPGADGAAAREGLMHALAELMNVLPASERRDVTCAELAALEAELQAELATPAHLN